MIQTDPTAPDAATAAAEVEAAHRLICEQECRLLELGSKASGR